jgi:hypothetical protein
MVTAIAEKVGAHKLYEKLTGRKVIKDGTSLNPE